MQHPNRRFLRRFVLSLLAMAALAPALAITDPAPVAAQPVISELPQPGLFRPLPPERIYDTRNEIGGPAVAFGRQGERTIRVTGVGGVPSANVASVALNVTVAAPTGASYLTIWPAGEARPTASNLNYGPGQTVANLVISKVGAGGAVGVYNDVGAAHVIIDVVGYFIDGLADPNGSSYHSVTPQRALDTRNSIGGPPAKLGPKVVTTLDFTGNGSVPADDVTAVALNVTVTGTTGNTFVTLYPADGSRPNASNVNAGPGATVANMAIVKVSPDGAVSIFNDVGETDVIIDVVGYFTTADSLGQHQGLSPERILDTRNGLGLAGGPLAPREQIDLTVLGVGGISLAGVDAVVVNVTATEPTANSFVTLWPSGVARPNASNLNMTPGRTVPNLVIVKAGANGKISLYNDAGFAHLLVDVVGYVTAGLANPSATAAPRLADVTPLNAPLSAGLAVESGPPNPVNPASLDLIAADLAGRYGSPKPGIIEPTSYATGVSEVSISQSTGLLVTYTTQGGGDPRATGQCTATLIGLNAVLTAYHCTFVPPDHTFHSWWFAPGASGSTAPYGWFVSTDPGSFIAEVATYPDDYQNLDFYPPFDFLVVPFEPNAQATVHPNVDPGAVAGFHEVLLDSPGGPRIMAGYAGESSSCASPTPDNLDCFQTFCYGGTIDWIPYREATGFEWQNHCQARPGMSGGPSFELFDGAWRVAGVVSNGTTSQPEPTSLTFGPYLSDDFEDLVRSVGVRT